MALQNDSDIMACLKTDAESCFRLLMTKYKAPIYWHIRRLVVSHDDAQDATQETFVRIFRSMGQLKDHTSLPAWIYKIATREALRLLGHRKGGEVSLDDLEAGGTDVPADEYVDYSDLEAVRLQKAIASLPTKQRLAFSLRYYDELGYDEIAEITGSTAAGVKANYHIAKDKIILYMNTTT